MPVTRSSTHAAKQSTLEIKTAARTLVQLKKASIATMVIDSVKGGMSKSIITEKQNVNYHALSKTIKNYEDIAKIIDYPNKNNLLMPALKALAYENLYEKVDNQIVKDALFAKKLEILNNNPNVIPFLDEIQTSKAAVDYVNEIF